MNVLRFWVSRPRHESSGLLEPSKGDPVVTSEVEIFLTKGFITTIGLQSSVAQRLLIVQVRRSHLGDACSGSDLALTLLIQQVATCRMANGDH